MGSDSDIQKTAADGAKIGGTIGAAGAAAIGLALGAAIPPPFSAVAAPLGAAIGALIGFFVGLAKRHEYTKEEIAENNAKAASVRQKTAEAVAAASNTASGLGNAAEQIMTQFPLWLIGAHWAHATAGDALDKQIDDWMSTSPQGQVLLTVAQNHPAYAPIIENFVGALKSIATAKATPGVKPTEFADSPEGKSMMKMVEFFHALAQMPGDLDADPFAYLRPPMAQYMGPALAAVGINISDPAVLNMIRGNYILSRSTPRAMMRIPIARASLNAKSGGRIAYDSRAFTLAPYGVGSFKMFPETAPTPQYTTDDDHGNPLSAPWPYGLDADNFAKPPPTTSKAANVAKVAIPAAVVALLFFL